MDIFERVTLVCALAGIVQLVFASGGIAIGRSEHARRRVFAVALRALVPVASWSGYWILFEMGRNLEPKLQMPQSAAVGLLILQMMGGGLLIALTIATVECTLFRGRTSVLVLALCATVPLQWVHLVL